MSKRKPVDRQKLMAKSVVDQIKAYLKEHDVVHFETRMDTAHYEPSIYSHMDWGYSQRFPTGRSTMKLHFVRKDSL